MLMDYDIRIWRDRSRTGIVATEPGDGKSVLVTGSLCSASNAFVPNKLSVPSMDIEVRVVHFMSRQRHTHTHDTAAKAPAAPLPRATSGELTRIFPQQL